MITYADFLLWLYGEMVLSHKEHPRLDYMLRLQQLGVSLLDKKALMLNPTPEPDQKYFSQLENLEKVSRLGLSPQQTTSAEFLAWIHDRLELKHRFHRLDHTMALLREVAVWFDKDAQQEADAAAFFALEALRNEAVSLSILSAEAITQDNFPTTIAGLIEAYEVKVSQQEDNSWHAVIGDIHPGWRGRFAEEAVLYVVIGYHTYPDQYRPK